MGDLSAGGSGSLKRIIVKKKTKSVTEKQKVKLHSIVFLCPNNGVKTLKAAFKIKVTHSSKS